MDLTRQFALPRGVGGRVVGGLMALLNAGQVKAVVDEVAPAAGERVLEIGFGPGVGLVRLARAGVTVRVAGIDPSSTMVAAAKHRTRRFGGRVEVREGSAASLPWDEEAFDGVCATNSVQLWQPRVGSMAEVFRVLRPGGRLVLGVHERAVLPKGGRVGPGFDDELVPDLETVGFTGVAVDWRPYRGGRALFVRGVRPAG